MTTTGIRPAELSGCWQAWTEKDQDQAITSRMDSGDTKKRRRFTARVRDAVASVTLPAASYQYFSAWYLTNCQAGVLPTMMVEPNGEEHLWQFAEPPEYDWIDRAAVRVSVKLRRKPGWE